MMSILLSQQRSISRMLWKTSTQLFMRVEMCITLMLMVQSVEWMKKPRGGWMRLKGKAPWAYGTDVQDNCRYLECILYVSIYCGFVMYVYHRFRHKMFSAHWWKGLYTVVQLHKPVMNLLCSFLSVGIKGNPSYSMSQFYTYCMELQYVLYSNMEE